MTHRPTYVAAALLLALCSASYAQQNTVRIGWANIQPNASASDATGPFLPGPPSGISLSVESQNTLFFAIAHSYNDHLEAELALGYPPTFNVDAKLNPAVVPAYVVSAFQGQNISKVQQVSPTLFANYKFGSPESAWRPYLGLGINYTKFTKRTSTATGNALNGGPTDIQLSDSWGLAAQAGVSYRVNDKWALNASLSTAQVKSTLTATTAGQTRSMDIVFHPVVFILSAGYSF